jgi:hypothetical protein
LLYLRRLDRAREVAAPVARAASGFATARRCAPPALTARQHTDEPVRTRAICRCL